MAALLQSIAGWPGAIFLQEYWIAYLIVNAAHILGIGLLLGAILPLDLCLVRSTRGRELPVLGPFLVHAAATGAALTVITGLWLFSVRPVEYAANPAFRYKAALLVLTACLVAVQHHGDRFASAVHSGQPTMRVRVLAASSAVAWLSILVAGRWIGFV
ncbi:hypothetical protein AO735_08665 [Pseudomonas sp. TTU2014-096BSC]|nr:hypothetical protein AO735_08665 [Pseudomonas sp. TTU2014-096BSC]